MKISFEKYLDIYFEIAENEDFSDEAATTELARRLTDLGVSMQLQKELAQDFLNSL